MDVHSKIKKLQEALDELKREIGYSDSGETENDELGEEINLSEFTEEDAQSHYDTHRF